MELNKIYQGDCLEVLKKLKENSVDSIVTDPPYELGFMGKSWDNTGIANNIEMWKECLRVLKPGGHLLAFGGTRTYHRMAVAIEDAGFEVRDMIEWVYGSGFPKSLNIGKAVDKLQGNEREVTGSEQKAKPTFHSQNVGGEITEIDNIEITKGTSPWEGWGTALKPAHEPIVWATKSLTFNKDFAILEDINNNLISTIWQSLENKQKQDISKLQETVLIHLNTALLWQNILAELLKNESKFTISTASKMITELKILNSLLLKNTQDDTDGKYQTCQNGIQESQVNGLDLLVGIVESCLGEEKKSITDIQTLIAQGLATYKQNKTGMSVKNAEQDLLPIILNANSVLISVLTDITTELNQNELNIFVSFAEKSLKQYLAEPQSIADESVWQEHIQKALPNHSPICMARKHLSEKTVAENCLKYGTGGINIDESRVEYSKENYEQLKKLEKSYGEDRKIDTKKTMFDGQSALKSNTPAIFGEINPTGRFPANLILSADEDGQVSEEVRECFPDTKSGKMGKQHKRHTDGSPNGIYGKFDINHELGETYGDSGNASRFFKSIIYQAKPSKKERNAGCEDMEEKAKVFNGQSDKPSKDMKDLEKRFTTLPKANNHPTVKPIALMEYLIKMVTPKGGIILDPFAGSGSTLVAAKQNNFHFIGIEREKDYCEIAVKRIGAVEKNLL